ncbi:MAG: hypothetical protein ACRD4T_12710 [Candidatus Acidiferrales bacterium]
MTMKNKLRLFLLPEPDTVVVVYDRKTGAVRHVHQEINLPGAKPGPAQPLKRALELAEELTGQARARLEAFPARTQDRRVLLESPGSVRVDLKRRRLVLARTRRALR